VLNQSKIVLASVGLFAGALGLQAVEANAATLTYAFEGRVTFGDSNIPTVGPNELIQGTFTYDTAATQNGFGGDSNTAFFNYFAADSGVTFNFTVGDFVVTQDNNPPQPQLIPVFIVGNSVEIGGVEVGDDFFRVTQNGAVSNTILGATVANFSLTLGDSSGTVFDSGLPPSALSLLDFDSSLISIGFTGSVFSGLTGEITSLTPVQPVPLPAALPLLAGGLGVLGMLGWRRKRKAVAA